MDILRLHVHTHYTVTYKLPSEINVKNSVQYACTIIYCNIISNRNIDNLRNCTNTLSMYRYMLPLSGRFKVFEDSI